MPKHILNSIGILYFLIGCVFALKTYNSITIHFTHFSKILFYSPFHEKKEERSFNDFAQGHIISSLYQDSKTFMISFLYIFPFNLSTKKRPQPN